MTDPLDAQERAIKAIADCVARNNGKNLAIYTAEAIRQAELEATKITPEMIEAGTGALNNMITYSNNFTCGEMAEAVLKAALGVE